MASDHQNKKRGIIFFIVKAFKELPCAAVALGALNHNIFRITADLFEMRVHSLVYRIKY